MKDRILIDIKEDVKTIDLPPLPSNIGKRRKTIDIKGDIRFFTILDEISFHQSTNPKKAIYIQRIQFEKEGSIELRLGYYIIGKKPRVIGKWVWGQFAMMLSPNNFCTAYRLAMEKGWLDC
ncbi:MAG: hypothetical protein C3F13_08265 [Anaerolineales bacterium]|nr:MAG: hypothetical protein C3F13_08265 [Anaerolineales bacterium]